MSETPARGTHRLLEGRSAIVTGGTRGLGRAAVVRLAAAGVRGVAIDLPDAVERADLPSGWSAVVGDVTDEDALASGIARATDFLGGLDIVVANAGIVPPWRETENLDLREWDSVFAVNVRGVAATIKHAVSPLRRKGGAIVAMASINAARAHPQQCLYTATKHAVLGIVRATALDLGRFGIRVNAVGPGPIATDALLNRLQVRGQTGGLPVSDALSQLSQTALGRMASESEVADAVVFLASPRSGGMTGQMLPIDAGQF